MKISRIRILLKEKKTKLQQLIPQYKYESSNLVQINTFIHDLEIIIARINSGLRLHNPEQRYSEYRRGLVYFFDLKIPQEEGQSLSDWYRGNQLHRSSSPHDPTDRHYIVGVKDIELYLYKNVNEQAVKITV